jgi:hypothetical protein
MADYGHYKSSVRYRRSGHRRRLVDPPGCFVAAAGVITSRTRFGCVLAATALCGIDAAAQPALPSSATQASNNDLSKESENPVSLTVSLPLHFQSDFNDGPYHATKDTFELDQAILPFRLSDDWTLITRTKLPAYSQPPKNVGDSWVSGLGNGYTTFFLSPNRGESFYWGAGPVLYYPSATNPVLGVNKWGSGPSVAFVRKTADSPWVYGAVVNNIWSFGGPPQSSDRTNSLLINPFLSFHFGEGWSVGSSPNITANWLAKAGRTWTVPAGGGVAKTFRLGGQPVKLAIDSYYNAVRPQAGNNTWLMQFTLTFLFPT